MLFFLNSEEGAELSVDLGSLELGVGRFEVAIDESFDVVESPCVSLLSLDLGIDFLFFLFQLSDLGRDCLSIELFQSLLFFVD